MRGKKKYARQATDSTNLLFLASFLSTSPFHTKSRVKEVNRCSPLLNEEICMMHTRDSD